MTIVNVKTATGYIPKKANEGDVGYDVIAISPPKIVWDGANINYIEYSTGIHIAPNENYYTLIYPRSSISKYNLQLCNSVGLVDTSYRGELMLRFRYITQVDDIKLNVDGTLQFNINFDRIYKDGDKIGQLVFMKREDVLFNVIDELDSTERGSGGFGSTGV